MNKLHPHPEPKLKVATSVVRKEEGEGPLFYILPPLLVVAVFAFCALSGSPTPAHEAASQGEAAAAAVPGQSEPQSPSSAENVAGIREASNEVGEASTVENDPGEVVPQETPVPEEVSAESSSQGESAAEEASDEMAPQEPPAAEDVAGVEE